MSVTDFLLFLIFLAPTIQYRVELRAFSFAVMEPIVLLASGVLIVRAIKRKEVLRIPRTWPEIGLIALVVWAILIRPWSQDWKHGLSDIRDWVIPVVTFLILRATVRAGWRRAIKILIAVAFLTAGVGIYQEVTDSFRPFQSPEATLKPSLGSLLREGSGWSPESGIDIWEYYAQRARLSEQGAVGEDEAMAALGTGGVVPLAVGFFAHANSMGLFLTASFFLALAWATQRHRLEGWLVLGAIGLAIFLTYAKASYVVLIGGLVGYFLLRRVGSLKVLAGIAVSSIILAAILMKALPSLLLVTLAARYALWTTALRLLADSPRFLLFGNGMDAFGQIAFYWQPHNAYIYMLLDFGILGLGLVIGVLASIAVAGWRDGRQGLWERDRMMEAAWIAVLSLFAVGMAESVLLGIEHRMIVLNFLACYLGLRHQVRASDSSGPSLTARSG